MKPRMVGCALCAFYFRVIIPAVFFPLDLNHVMLLHIPRCAHFISKIIMRALAREQDNLAAFLLIVNFQHVTVRTGAHMLFIRAESSYCENIKSRRSCSSIKRG